MTTRCSLFIRVVHARATSCDDTVFLVYLKHHSHEVLLGARCLTVCIGYRDLTLPSLLTAPAAMLTVSGRDYVDRPTHEFGAELDCKGFP
jgi:hypothetical protein